MLNLAESGWGPSFNTSSQMSNLYKLSKLTASISRLTADFQSRVLFLPHGLQLLHDADQVRSVEHSLWEWENEKRFFGMCKSVKKPSFLMSRLRRIWANLSHHSPYQTSHVETTLLTEQELTLCRNRLGALDSD